VHRLLVTANIVPSSPIPVTLAMETLSSSETSVFLQEPHGVTSQKTPFFIITALKTSNLTIGYSFFGLTVGFYNTLAGDLSIAVMSGSVTFISSALQ
jgi:hypothetical protein